MGFYRVDSDRNPRFPPADAFVEQANVSGMAAYQALCRQAETDYEGFWRTRRAGR